MLTPLLRQRRIISMQYDNLLGAQPVRIKAQIRVYTIGDAEIGDALGRAGRRAVVIGQHRRSLRLRIPIADVGAGRIDRATHLLGQSLQHDG